MAIVPIAQRLSQLEARTRTLRARMIKQDRAKNTRRKILLGEVVLPRIEQNRDDEFSRHLGDWLRRELPKVFTTKQDAALFTDLLGTKAESPAPMTTTAETTETKT